MPIEETVDEPQGGAPSRIQILQDAANMGVLARQALSNGFESMAVDPKICANVALLVEELKSSQTDAVTEAPAPSEAVLKQVKEEGRREAIAEFAEERLRLLQRITELSPVPTVSDVQESPSGDGGNDFKGPGQT